MDLGFMMLANYAEAPPGGLVYIMGGGVDTVTVHAPLQGPGAPPDAFAVVGFFLVINLKFHSTESGRDYELQIRIADEDGNEIGKGGGSVRVDRAPGLPPTWKQGVNLVLPMLGMPVPRPGQYMITLNVNSQFVGEQPFRVLKGY